MLTIGYLWPERENSTGTIVQLLAAVVGTLSSGKTSGGYRSGSFCVRWSKTSKPRIQCELD